MKALVVLVAAVAVSACGGDEIPAAGPTPLALSAGDGGDMARNEGTLVITERCSFLERGGERQLLVWPGPRTEWSAATGEIEFTTLDGRAVRLGSGDAVVLAGGGSSRQEDGLDGEAWAERIEWALPPDPQCLVDVRFFVSDVSMP